MIRIAYYHGDDLPARDLTVGQVRAAMLDPAGTLWVDIEAPSTEELDSGMVRELGLDPGITRDSLTAGRPSAVRLIESESGAIAAARLPPASDGDRPDGSPIAVWLAPNWLVTCRSGTDERIDALLAAVESDPWLLAEGADRLVARLLDATVADARRAADRLGAKAADLHRRVLERPRRREVEQMIRTRHAATRLDGDLDGIVDGAALLAAAASPARSANQVYYAAVGDAARDALEGVRRTEQLMSDVLDAHGAMEASRTRRALDRLLLVAFLALMVITYAVVGGGPAWEVLGSRYSLMSAGAGLVGVIAVVAVALLGFRWIDRR
ncbi:MAG: CorA family divalent cation transporter [Anaerolineae bacterium]